MGYLDYKDWHEILRTQVVFLSKNDRNAATFLCQFHCFICLVWFHGSVVCYFAPVVFCRNYLCDWVILGFVLVMYLPKSVQFLWLPSWLNLVKPCFLLSESLFLAIRFSGSFLCMSVFIEFWQLLDLFIPVPLFDCPENWIFKTQKWDFEFSC